MKLTKLYLFLFAVCVAAAGNISAGDDTPEEKKLEKKETLVQKYERELRENQVAAADQKNSQAPTTKRLDPTRGANINLSAIAGAGGRGAPPKKTTPPLNNNSPETSSVSTTTPPPADSVTDTASIYHSTIPLTHSTLTPDYDTHTHQSGDEQPQDFATKRGTLAILLGNKPTLLPGQVAEQKESVPNDAGSSTATPQLLVQPIAEQKESVPNDAGSSTATPQLLVHQKRARGPQNRRLPSKKNTASPSATQQTETTTQPLETIQSSVDSSFTPTHDDTSPVQTAEVTTEQTQEIDQPTQSEMTATPEPLETQEIETAELSEAASEDQPALAETNTPSVDSALSSTPTVTPEVETNSLSHPSSAALPREVFISILPPTSRFASLPQSITKPSTDPVRDVAALLSSPMVSSKKLSPEELQALQNKK